MVGLTYFSSELFLAFARRSSSGGISKDANSLRILWIVIMVSLAFGIQGRSLWSGAILPIWSIPVGVILFALGLVLRWYSIIHLGRFFTVSVTIAPDHQLVETGPYRFVRHPSYTGAVLAFIGFGFTLRNWASVLVIAIPITLAFLYRIRVEEGALTGALGERYCVYSKQTKRLIPFIY